MSAPAEEVVDTVRPSRPVLVEIAAAILIGVSAIDFALTLESYVGSAGGASGERAFASLSIAIAVAMVVLGVLIRSGRAWVVAVNVVAVVAFLEAATATVPGLVFGALDAFVVFALLRERWWFNWTPRTA